MDYRQLGIGCSDIVVANEYHTDRIYAVGAEEAGYGVIKAHNGDYFDAMVTQKEGLMLCIHTADCVPLVLLDPVEKAVGIVHSGWAGASKRIAGKTIKKMMEVYKSSPENIICAMGPYNHSCCYEVGEDVLERFRLSKCRPASLSSVVDGRPSTPSSALHVDIYTAPSLPTFNGRSNSIAFIIQKTCYNL